MIIKSNNFYKEQFTILSNAVINDERLSTKAIGAFVKMISKSANWEISALGMSKISKEGVDFWQTCFKELCKFGYLIRIPQTRKQGRFQKVEMILYPEPQFNEPLDDKIVEKLFNRDSPITEDELQKIFPKRVFRHGSSATEKPAQQRKEDERKEDERKDSCFVDPSDPPPENRKEGEYEKEEDLHEILSKKRFIEFEGMKKREKIPIDEFFRAFVSEEFKITEVYSALLELENSKIRINNPVEWVRKTAKNKYAQKQKENNKKNKPKIGSGEGREKDKPQIPDWL